MCFTFMETWHHEDYGVKLDLQNIWLKGWDITARTGRTGSSPPSLRATSPALTIMSTSVIIRVGDILKSLKIIFSYLCVFAFPEKFAFYFKHTSYMMSVIAPIWGDFEAFFCMPHIFFFILGAFDGLSYMVHVDWEKLVASQVIRNRWKGR